MASFSDSAFSTTAFSVSAFDMGISGIVQPVLPVIRPKFRSADAKSMADVYNRGLPEMPDYEWPNRRKFYQ